MVGTAFKMTGTSHQTGRGGGLQGHYDNGGGDGLLGVAGDDASLHEVLDNEDGLNIVAVDHGGLGEVVEGAVLFREVISGIAATGRG